MSEYILIGYVCGTHGIKGELKIKSNFAKKDLVFQLGNHLYFGPEHLLETIKTYRYHKIYDMVTLAGYFDINEVLKYVRLDVYVKRSELTLPNGEYLMSDLIGYTINDQGIILGKVIDYVYNKINPLLVIAGSKTFYIPYNQEYIKEVNQADKVIKTSKAKDLML
jgi:16S rRNA processing protein RimM